MSRGLDSSFLHYGVRKQDLVVIAELCKKHDLDEDWVINELIKAYHEQKVNSIEVQQSNFPDKTLLLKISDAILQNCDNTGYINIHWLYENDAELFTLICVKRYLDENFCHKAIHFSL